jgi:hypothetical protein
MGAQIMSLHCDHCRGDFGRIVHVYWQMRFCSQTCGDSYQSRLADDTKAKIHRLDFGTRDRSRSIAAPLCDGGIQRTAG